VTVVLVQQPEQVLAQFEPAVAEGYRPGKIDDGNAAFLPNAEHHAPFLQRTILTINCPGRTFRET
jgi:hypothetical protein